MESKWATTKYIPRWCDGLSALLNFFFRFKCQPNHERGNCIPCVHCTLTSLVECNLKCFLADVPATFRYPHSLRRLFRLNDVVNRSSTFNRVDPVIKSNVLVPSHGYTVVRFTSNNPGVWFMHCHQDMHAAVGMKMIWNEAPEHHPPLPPGFGACVDYEWTAEQFQDYLQSNLQFIYS